MIFPLEKMDRPALCLMAPVVNDYTTRRIMTYSKIDNPVIAALVKVFQPFLRGVVNDKLSQGFLAVHTLGELMAADPELVYRQAEAVPDANKADVDALRVLLLPALRRSSP